ncbi:MULTISPECIES: hypothetical protein [unclassified Clostridium]|uniref:hypothetical protein n=1 Tax=unclassified Clostridium TaxID=2614128 RepID=UPI003F8EF302
MKNKNYFILGILLSVISIVSIFLGLKFNTIVSGIALIGLFIGIGILEYWSTISYEWICDECGERFYISLKENMLGINGGVNYKSLYCPKCHKKTMCKGVLIK